jgi:hypothetical protein
MKEIFYKKVGRRYVPVSEYDSELFDSMPKGTHLVMCYPGGRSIRYNVNPNYAALIAASRVAETAMTGAIRKASELKPRKKTITEAQKKAWNNLAQEFGDDLATLQIDCASDIAEAGLKALQAEADKLMKHESVKRAYEQFLLVCELTKKENA